MIGFIRGKVVASLAGSILIENNGIGYEVNVTDTSPAILKCGTSEEITVYTVMVVREDDISLYGFTNHNDVTMFQTLTGVSGVGAKAAMSMLSVLSAEEISKAILFDDIASITRAQGIGKKIAQRVVMELKDKIGGLSGLASAQNPFSTSQSIAEDPQNEALQALVSLGYSKTEAGEILTTMNETYDTAEQYIKAALKKLM